MSKAGLYIHFPFCRRSCFYCHFFKKRYAPAAAEAATGLLLREMRLRRDPALPVDSVYFGGGSPSLMTPRQIARLLDAAAGHFRLAARPEVTLEANPDDLSPTALKGWRASGISRLSIGVQSFQDRDLRFLRRRHDAALSARAVAMSGDAGFANVSLDLMIGLPTQTRSGMEMNFRLVGALRPAHVSVYILEGVPRPAEDRRDVRLYHQARQCLAGLGFAHYEVSNYGRPGRFSRHNLKYWRMEPYVAVGPSAAGFVGGRDYRNASSLERYAAAVTAGRLPEVRTRQLDPARRRIVTGLRLLDGIPASAFASFPGETAFLLREKMLVRRGRNIAVHAEKILLLNEILGYFI